MDQREMKEKIEEFKNDIEVKQSFDTVWEKYQEFISLYPFREHPESIELLTPEKTYRLGAQDYFFLWIEQKLKSLGHLRAGNPRVWENARNKIDKLKQLIKRTVDDNLSLSEKIDSNWEEIAGFGGNKGIAKKIVYLYYPNEVLDIFNTEDGEYFAKKLNIDFRKEAINDYEKPYEDLTLGQRFELLNKLILDFKNRSEDFKNWHNDLFTRFLYQIFPPQHLFAPVFSLGIIESQKKKPKMRTIRILVRIILVIILGIIVFKFIGVYRSVSERDKSLYTDTTLKQNISTGAKNKVPYSRIDTGYTIPKDFRISQNQHLKIKHHQIEFGEVVVLGKVKGATSDKEINLCEVALLLTEKIYPTFHHEPYLDKVDKMAEELRKKIGKETKLEKVITIINHYLFKTMRAQAKEMLGPILTKEGYYSSGTFLLTEVIMKMEGNCFGLSTLYLSIAERLGLPLYGVRTPDHVFVRYDDGKYQRNIETTGYGRKYSDEVYRSGEYSEKGRVFPENEAIYLRNLSKKEYIGEILCARGLLFKDKGDLDNALADYNMAVELDPKLAWAYVNRGNLYRGAGKLDKALTDFNKAIELDPKSVEAYCSRGKLYRRINRIDRALADFDKAIELEPKNANYYINRGKAYAEEGIFNLAIRDCSKAIELTPKDASTYFQRGRVYMKQRNFNRAIADFTKAIKLDPKDASAYHNRGWVYRKQGDFNRAITDLNRVIQLDPRCALAYYNRAWAYAKKKNFNQAVADGKKFLELAPHHSDAPEIRRAIYYWKEKLRKK